MVVAVTAPDPAPGVDAVPSVGAAVVFVRTAGAVVCADAVVVVVATPSVGATVVATATSIGGSVVFAPDTGAGVSVFGAPLVVATVPSVGAALVTASGVSGLAVVDASGGDVVTVSPPVAVLSVTVVALVTSATVVVSPPGLAVVAAASDLSIAAASDSFVAVVFRCRGAAVSADVKNSIKAASTNGKGLFSSALESSAWATSPLDHFCCNIDAPCAAPHSAALSKQGGTSSVASTSCALQAEKTTRMDTVEQPSAKIHMRFI